MAILLASMNCSVTSLSPTSPLPSSPLLPTGRSWNLPLRMASSTSGPSWLTVWRWGVSLLCPHLASRLLRSSSWFPVLPFNPFCSSILLKFLFFFASALATLLLFSFSCFTGYVILFLLHFSSCTSFTYFCSCFNNAPNFTFLSAHAFLLL